MSETKLLLENYFPNAIVNDIFMYFCGKSTRPYHRGQAGEFEVCSQIIDEKSLQKAFIGACAGGWIELVQCLLLNGAQITEKACIAACKFGHFDIVDLFLTQTIICPNSNCIFEALFAGHVQIANLFNPKNTPTSEQLESLQIQLYEKNDEAGIEVLHRFLKSDNQKFLDRASFNACRNGHLEVVQKMIADGSFNPEGCLPHACKSGNIEIIEILLKIGVGKLLYYRQLGFQYACAAGYFEIVKIMLPHIKYDQRWISIGVCKAFENQHIEIAQFLIDQYHPPNCFPDVYYGGNTDHLCIALQKQTDCPETEFFIGWMHNNREATILLLNFLRSRNKLYLINIEESLFKICKKGNNNLMDLLIDLALETKFQISSWRQIFFEACRNGHLECVKILIQNGVKTFRQGASIAILSGQFELANYLESLVVTEIEMGRLRKKAKQDGITITNLQKNLDHLGSMLSNVNMSMEKCVTCQWMGESDEFKKRCKNNQKHCIDCQCDCEINEVEQNDIDHGQNCETEPRIDIDGETYSAEVSYKKRCKLK